MPTVGIAFLTIVAGAIALCALLALVKRCPECGGRPWELDSASCWKCYQRRGGGPGGGSQDVREHGKDEWPV